MDKQKTVKNNVFSVLSRPMHAAWSAQKYNFWKKSIFSIHYFLLFLLFGTNVKLNFFACYSLLIQTKPSPRPLLEILQGNNRRGVVFIGLFFFKEEPRKRNISDILTSRFQCYRAINGRIRCTSASISPWPITYFF